ncbi:unnamed protein product [Microthlaspi erraticum]|uniref:NB-ARC domain-containing protein n=1 Tax=Microthlaspi erraticum TaxID=1685480 RepID=A0A6D2IXB8_9BRAS|nr:unnamed protein product [Microthlaspi erraticum]
MDYGILKSLENAWRKDSGFLARRIVEMSMSLPAAVVVLAKSLNSIAQKLPICLSPKQGEVFKIAVLSYFPTVDAADRKRAPSRRNPILRLTYELLQTDNTLKSAILDCFWHSLSFFEHCGCIYYQELIAHWILEGYFDPVRSVTNAYKDGYIILMELLNRGILKIQEGNMVVPEVAMKNLIDLRRRGLSGTSRIGLAKVCGSNMTKGLGNINYVDDVIKGVRVKRKGGKITTILVSGNRLRQETPEKFFEKLKDLEILALFVPTLDPFVPSLSKLWKLRVLVIRDCDLLKDIEELKTLHGLHVLEISGASSLMEISDGFFVAMPGLQSLHLSGLQIKYSPSSISKLKGLHRLIIRDCPVLEDLPDIQELVNLEVVDVSGARGLQTNFDKATGENKNKNFYHLTKLQLLDFSESQIERLPMFQDSAVAAKLHSLTRLLLRNCSKLRKLSNLKPLSGLQILDLSGTTSLVRMSELCLEDKKELIILNLSGTNLRQLPSTIKELSNLSELILRNCPNLEALPNIRNLTNLEVFDVTGCTKLHTVEGSFVDMSYLREVSLSRTKLKIPPKLPKKSKLCCRKSIIFADCSFLESEIWGQITKAITTQMLENASCSGVVVKSQEISKMDPKEEREIHSNEPCSSDFPGKRGISRECFGQDPVYVGLYYKSIPFVDAESHLKVLEIHESNGLGGSRDLDKEALANAEFVSFVDCSSPRLIYILNEIISAKGCWLRMCMDVKDLFSGVDEERLGSLATLSITNLPLLDSINCGGSFKTLKKLSIDCCPKIQTLFPEASQLPSSLEVLHIKFCEKLEKVFEEEGKVSTLTTLCLHELPALSAVRAKLPNLKIFSKTNCPKLYATKENLKGSVCATLYSNVFLKYDTLAVSSFACYDW